jgi:hypothetical protein
VVSFAWGGLSNGRIPEDRMVSIGGGNFLRADAAGHFEDWARAFNERFGKQLIASEGYRPYAEQVRLKEYWTSRGQSYKAAAPGGSIHGWGLAVDIYSWVYLDTTDSAEHKWMRENAPTYGFDWYTTGAPIDEPWHFDYVGGATTASFISQPLEDTLSAAEVAQIQEHTQAVANNLLMDVQKIVDEAKNVPRRESRFRAFKNKDTSEVVLVSWSTGATFGPTSEAAFLAVWAQENIVSPIDVERAVQLDAASFNTLLEHAAGVRKQLAS